MADIPVNSGGGEVVDTIGDLVSTNDSWSRIPHDESLFGGPDGQSMVGVTVGGPGFVAVGGDSGDAVVWTSVDGIAWSRVPHDEAVFGGPSGVGMSSVTQGGPGLVAVGGDGADIAVWTSVDGIAWSRVAHDETVFGEASVRSVVAGGPGLVAVGDDEPGDNTSMPFNVDAVVWTSVDGFVWSRVAHDETVFGGEEKQSMNDGSCWRSWSGGGRIRRMLHMG